MGETNEESEERVEERTITQAHDTWMGWRAQTREPLSCDKSSCVREKKATIEVYCLHTHRRLQQIAISCKRTYYKKKWAPPVLIPLPSRKTGRRRQMPSVVLMKRDWFWSFFSRFSVETVHYCDCCSEVWSEFFYWCISAWFVQWDLPVFLISLVLLRGWAVGVLIGPSRCTSPQASQFWVANHDTLNLVGSDRDFLQISFWDISSAHCGPRNALSLPQFCRADDHEVAPAFWWRSAGLRKHPVAIGENFGWIRFQPRVVHKCNRVLLDFNREDILSIALLELFRTTRITLSCPIRRSSPSNCCWMGCRRYSAASRLEVLLAEDDFRSFWRALERGNFRLPWQLSVTVLALWNQCCVPSLDPPWRGRKSTIHRFVHTARGNRQECLDCHMQLWNKQKPSVFASSWKRSRVIFGGRGDVCTFLVNDFYSFHHNSSRDTKSW